MMAHDRGTQYGYRVMPTVIPEWESLQRLRGWYRVMDWHSDVSQAVTRCK